MLIHLAALLFYGLFAAAFLFRLFPVWNTHIPGGQQDTRFLLWNDWWFHEAIDHLHVNPFHTTLLYHPFGTSLVLTDSPLWNCLVTYAAQHAGLTLISSANISFLLSWILMGFATYLLAWEITKRHPPALVAGLLVMTHSFTLGCTMQNWTRFNLYGIPLFLWTLVRARRSGRVRDYILSGLALAWTAACHYYFLVYSLLIWMAVFVADYCPVGFRMRKRAAFENKSWGRFGLVVSFAAAAVSAWIIFGHPTDLFFGKTRIGMETPYNALLVMWSGLALWVVSGFKVHRYDRRAELATPSENWKMHAILLATAFVCLLPLFLPLLAMVLHGEYPRQTILWKTHRPGANLISLIIPNPTHILWGPAITRWYHSRDMIVQEQAAALGWVFLVLVALTRPWRLGRSAQRWFALAIGSTLLAMGSYLHVAQYNLWLPLPFYFLRLLPVAGNARVPSHWMAVGAVACAVVAAMMIIRLAEEKKWSLTKLSAIVGALILLENWPGITIAEPPAQPPIYETLRRQPPGAVLTLPLYIGDSSIGAGDSRLAQWIFPWDHLWAQIAHQKPILGGYIGRISRHMIEKYKADPFIATLLDLEENKVSNIPPNLSQGLRAAEAFNFKYVLVYPSATDAGALRYALGSLPLEPVEKTETIQLYRIKE